MTKIAELKDKGAVVAWSPVGGGGSSEGEYADVIALGSKVRSSSRVVRRASSSVIVITMFVCWSYCRFVSHHHWAFTVERCAC